jgi:DNA-binding HxlR family transcriptional regulator
VRTYGQYCPIARAAEVLGDRWTLLIVREMTFGVGHFNELQRCLPGISRSVLSQRLRQLQHSDVIERTDAAPGEPAGYRLTPAGRSLKPVLHALGEWAGEFAFAEPDPTELDPDLVLRWISRHTVTDRLPARAVVEFVVTKPQRRYWLIMTPDEASVCLHHPGFDVDVTVTAATVALYDVYLGRRTLADAVRAQLLTLQGTPAKVRAFPTWFRWSAFAPAVARGVQARRAPTTRR